MSAGGALGGLLVSLVAPRIFKTFLEWPVALVAGFALVTVVACVGLMPKWRGIKAGVWRAAWFAIGAAGLWLMSRWEFSAVERLERTRDFYGALSVSESFDEQSGDVMRYFVCSGTTHGTQDTAPDHRRDALSYYGPGTGIGIALNAVKPNPGARVGVIGMGAGTVAAYAERGQTYHFYEINPEVVRIAQQWFTYIPDMQERGAKFELALGDARLSMEHEMENGRRQEFDVLLIDAFSGDSIPVHLLTQEALNLYLGHMKHNGVIVVHVTNHYLNLAPVVERLARESGLHTTRISQNPVEPGSEYTDYVLLSRDEAFIKAHPALPPEDSADIEVPLWTDHRHNLFQILQNR
jgi:protein-L-isoaspartate O-methyltransferase